MATARGGLSSLVRYSSEGDGEGYDTKLGAGPSSQTNPIGSRSVSTLWSWLERHGIQISGDVEVVDTIHGGWTLRAVRDLPEYHALCKIPKTAILSLRTTSLVLPDTTPGYEPRSTHSVWFLALALLHETRLGKTSRYYGYIQSLPRETIRLPMLWGVYELCGEDGRLALELLRGTDAARDLKRQKLDGKSADDLERFFDLYSNLLPPTKLHSQSSSFIEYLYAYSLVSTRAFVIDLYHTLALCPFADILNHAHPAHTSLSSDDFVCHICGSLRVCPHDRPSTTGVPRRLDELSVEAIRRLEKEEDTVDLIVEVEEIKAGEEIFNSYGADLSSSQLLREWGYLDRGDRGYITFDLDELGGEPVFEVWAESLAALVANDGLIPSSRLIAPVPTDNPCLLRIHRSTGSISLGIWCQIYISIRLSGQALGDLSSREQAFRDSLSQDVLYELAKEWQTSGSDASVRRTVKLAAQQVMSVLQTRLAGIAPSQSPTGPLSQMAYDYAGSERDELQRFVEQWQKLAQNE